MATVGRNRAVTESFNIRLVVLQGWLVWMALHLMLPCRLSQQSSGIH